MLLVAFFFLPGMAAGDGPVAFDYILELPANVKTVLVAETDTATLHRYSINEQGRISAQQQPISIGQNGAGKKRSGDRRTPLGVYFVIEELSTTNLHEKYGPIAFPLDYPNAWDTRNSRTGHGIWIHGVTPGAGPRPERDTDGCISLANAELLLLEPYLAPLDIPVIVTRKIRKVSSDEISSTRDQLTDALTSWAQSYKRGDWYGYLSLYAEEFEYRGMNRDEWSTYRLDTVGDRAIEDFVIDDILLVADPEEPDLYLSRFRQSITEAGRTISTAKRLYWRRSEQGVFEIVAEDNG